MGEIQTDDTPASIGPSSQGFVDDDRVFVSDQGPVDPKTGDVVNGNVRTQRARTLGNVASVLEAGDSLDSVLKSTLLVTDLADSDAVKGVYSE